MSSTTGYIPITVVNVFEQNGAAPNLLQRTGAFVSQGGTTLAAGSTALLSVPSSLTSLLNGALALTSLAWSGGTVTATATAAHGFTIGDEIPITVSGAMPAGYNGTFTATVTTTTAFTYPVASNPGSETIPGVYTPEDVAELVAMNTTFWAQGNAATAYVLELGAGSAADGVTALTTWITANPGVVYSYLVPHDWGILPAFYTFAANFTSTTAKTYFHVTTTLAYWQANPTVFKTSLKSVLVTIEAPSVANLAAAGTPVEFSAAARFYRTLALQPSSTNRVTQLQYNFTQGTTAYPRPGNSSLFVSLNTANIGIIGQAGEGGLSNTFLLYGKTLDGNDFNKYWYSVDNVQINLDLQTSNAVINGSNNPLAPLDYNQAGINTLQAVAVQVMQNEVAYGLALGQVVATQLSGADFAAAIAAGAYAGQIVVNAEPFSSYVQSNPSNYPLGAYGGLSVAYTVQLGFTQIIYNVTVSNFVA